MFDYRTWVPVLSGNRHQMTDDTPHSPQPSALPALQLTATLFGEWALMAEWGRIGSAGRLFFPSRELAQAALSRRQSVKMRRGYRPTAP
jgi:hypothetical protein